MLGAFDHLHVSLALVFGVELQIRVDNDHILGGETHEFGFHCPLEIVDTRVI